MQEKKILSLWPGEYSVLLTNNSYFVNWRESNHCTGFSHTWFLKLKHISFLLFSLFWETSVPRLPEELKPDFSYLIILSSEINWRGKNCSNFRALDSSITPIYFTSAFFILLLFLLQSFLSQSLSLTNSHSKLGSQSVLSGPPFILFPVQPRLSFFFIWYLFPFCSSC